MVHVIVTQYGKHNVQDVIYICIIEYVLRPIILFLDMFIKLYLVGIMLLYILKVRLPISYRIWSGLNLLSLLIYN
jgi:hypothetical protein